MSYSLKDSLVVGISSRALFNLEIENEIFQEEGVAVYRKYQLKNEDVVLEKGTAFYLIESLLRLNKLSPDKRLVEVIIMSKNSPDLGLRLLNSIEHYKLDITRSAFTSGMSLSPYIEAFDVDLFLSKSEKDVQEVIDSGKAAAALIYESPKGFKPDEHTVRIAFDADAVIFSDESEKIFKTYGLSRFEEHERSLSNIPMQEGPFAKLLKTLSKIQRVIDPESEFMRIAIVTARNYPANVRIIKTLREWKVSVDEAFFLGGLAKDKILQAFKAHIFFDDQDTHVLPASMFVPSSRVPYKTNKKEDSNSR